MNDLDGIRRALLAWYRRGHRELPWRRARDPYAIWVSEIMLQQTRVETVTPYWQRWMARFPSVRALAEAPLDDVLAHWAGLGYYARARNLHAAAREIVAHHDARFPDEPEAVRALPGIGPYTAGAIMSIAFGRREPILDGNVARVLARLCFVEERRAQWALAAELVPEDAPGDFNQAMMELGATVCTPRAPACGGCPLAPRCAAKRDGVQESVPAVRKRAPLRTVEQVTVLVEKQGKLLLLRRPTAGLWGGLWEPPTGERGLREDPSEAAARVVRSSTGLAVDRVEELRRFDHVLTHRRMRFLAYRARPSGRVRVGGTYEAARWLAPAAVAAQVGVAAWAERLLLS